MRKQFERLCFKHRDKGIPNLMLYICLGSALVYIFTIVTRSTLLYSWLCFDRNAILHGQIWRLFSYALTYGIGSDVTGILWVAIGLLCYYSLGRALEHMWGTLKFNLFYLSGIVMMDIYCMIFGGYASVTYLNLSLFLSYATLFPDAQFLILFIIPVKAWVLGLIDLVLCLYGLFASSFPANLFSVISLANYFLFFGKDVLNLIPSSWRANASRLWRKVTGKKTAAKPIPFPKAGSYQAEYTKPTAPYTHRCTVCGRTDSSDPDLEFRYCSRCKGYYCYCQDHISSHAHIQ